MNAAAAMPHVTAPAQGVALYLHPRRRLLPLIFFSILFGFDEDDALALVEDHKLAPAFNLATHASGRRNIRVWRGSVEQWSPGQSIGPRAKVDDVITAALPSLCVGSDATASVCAIELARRFCLAPDTIAQFLHVGELIEVGRHNSACESPRVSRSSVTAFLKRRVL